ncbi:MAG: hypothetical protein ACPW60_07755 [Methylohalobius sp. ZOD2]
MAGVARKVGEKFTRRRHLGAGTVQGLHRMTESQCLDDGLLKFINDQLHSLFNDIDPITAKRDPFIFRTGGHKIKIAKFHRGEKPWPL